MNDPTVGEAVSQPGTSQEASQKPQRFGLKHALALVFAVGITVLIFVFQDQVRQLAAVGYVGIFLTMLLTSATLVLPAPGLAFVYVLGGTLNPLLVGLLAGTGSTLGELTGFAAGFSGSGVVENTQLYQRIERWLRRYDVLVLFVLAVIPNPLFDVAGLAAGALGMKWWKFLLATWVGKTIKTIVFAYAGALSIGWVQQLLTR